MDGWVDGWIDGWMDGWTDGHVLNTRNAVCCITIPQRYHQATTVWEGWRALSLYAFAANGRSPRPSSLLTPSLRLRTFLLLCCCVLLLLLLLLLLLSDRKIAQHCSRHHGITSRRLVRGDGAPCRSTLGRRIGVRPRLLLWRCRHPYTTCALLHHRNPFAVFSSVISQAGSLCFSPSAQEKERGCYESYRKRLGCYERKTTYGFYAAKLRQRLSNGVAETGDNGNAMFTSKVRISKIPATRFLYRSL